MLNFTSMCLNFLQKSILSRFRSLLITQQIEFYSDGGCVEETMRIIIRLSRAHTTKTLKCKGARKAICESTAAALIYVLVCAISRTHKWAFTMDIDRQCAPELTFVICCRYQPPSSAWMFALWLRFALLQKRITFKLTLQHIISEKKKKKTTHRCVCVFFYRNVSQRPNKIEQDIQISND